MASILDLLPLLLKTVPAVRAGMSGVNLGPSAQTSADINQLAKAQTNMMNPLFQSMLMQNKQAGQSNLAATIAQLQAQNRLALSSGQKPLLDQERGGESIFRNLVQGQQDVGNQAMGQTFDQLRNAQAGLQGSYNTQNNLAQNRFTNTQKKVGAYGNMSDALKGLFGLNKQQPQATSQNSVGSYNTPLPPAMQQKSLSLLPTNYGYQATGGY